MARPRMGASDSRDFSQEKHQEYDLPSTGNIDRSDFANQFETVDSRISDDVLKAMAFYEEEIIVEVIPTDNPNAESLIQLQCNGVNQFLIRGIPTTIKRKYLEILAMSKTEIIATPESVDGKGNKMTKIIKTQGSRYPFRVLRDDNPNGPAWLQKVMRQPV